MRLAPVLVAVVSFIGLAAPPDEPPRGTIGSWSASASGSEVLVGATSRQPGSAHGNQPRDETDAQPAPPRDCGALNRCDDFTVSLLPQATITDVASFAPQPGALSSQPAGYGVAGLPLDFLIAASQHTATGTLFDLPVTVRFTPDEIVIAPGDGSTRTVAATARTPASHTYRSRGSYVATATVRYRAEVDFGRGWRPVPGALEIPTAGYTVEVLEARGTLVDRVCTEPPSGPGC
ncbi:MAG: hypothetical protein K0S70_2316 [Microbacterium sp.]|nr:hypothetical protein [Microbacterium sp.]